MKVLMIGILVYAAVFAANAQELNEPLRQELLAMEKADQDARVKCTNGTADEQIKCLQNAAEKVDGPNTKRLEAIYEEFGFPTLKMVGEDGFRAFRLLLQHSYSQDLWDKSLKPIKKAYERKELSSLDYANFIDRYHLRKGEPQIYGSGFETRDGKLVMSPTKDLKNLEKRRKKIGLPPMSEYIKVLKEIYKLEVEAPKL